MPHLLAADLAATDSPGLRWLACDACWYLLARGDIRTAYDLAVNLRQQWRERLGDDDEHTLEIAHYLGWALQAMGRYAEARDLDQDTLDRRRRVAGRGPPQTPWSPPTTWPSTWRCWARCRPPGTWTRTPWTAAAGCWARTTPTPWAPRTTWPPTCARWGRCRRPGTWTRTPWTAAAGCWAKTTPDTLNSANNLAIDLRELGEVQAARDLDQDTLDRRRRVLGEDHPEHPGLREQPGRRPARAGGGAGRPGPGPGHPGPPPPGAGRGPPRHPELREQPGRRPARAGARRMISPEA